MPNRFISLVEGKNGLIRFAMIGTGINNNW